MEAQNQQPLNQKPQLKLYIYGSRESDQFWLPTSHSHSKRPFCLTNVQKMETSNEDDDEEAEDNIAQNKPILNPLFGKKIYKIACGGMHSIVLTTEGEAYTFGCNDEGALGRKGSEQVPGLVKVADPIDLISAGDNHSMFANSVNGAIYFSGNYNYLRGDKMTESIFEPTCTYVAEINHSLKNKKIDKITSGNNHSCVLIHGSVFCKGQPDAFTIGRRISARHKIQNSLTFNGVNLSHIVDVQCGGYHTIVKTVSKSNKTKYYSWGKNDSGQLGIGSYIDQPYPSEITRLRNKNVTEMAAGTSFSLFLTENGELYGCGSNEDGNLGLGEDYTFEESGEEDEKEEEVSENVEPKPENSPSQGQAVENKEGEAKMSEQKPVQEVPEPQKNEDQLKKIRMHNIFIKSIRKIETPEPLDRIAAGSEYAYGWNNNNLYSWGSGMGYILLNGEEQDEPLPFNVKKKILNEHRIYDMAPGGLHAMYTSYSPVENSSQFKVQPEKSIWQNLTSYKKKLSRRKN